MSKAKAEEVIRLVNCPVRPRPPVSITLHTIDAASFAANAERIAEAIMRALEKR